MLLGCFCLESAFFRIFRSTGLRLCSAFPVYCLVLSSSIGVLHISVCSAVMLSYFGSICLYELSIYSSWVFPFLIGDSEKRVFLVYLLVFFELFYFCLLIFCVLYQILLSVVFFRRHFRIYLYGGFSLEKDTGSSYSHLLSVFEVPSLPVDHVVRFCWQMRHLAESLALLKQSNVYWVICLNNCEVPFMVFYRKDVLTVFLVSLNGP